MFDLTGAGSGEIIINGHSLYCAVLTGLLQINSLQLLCVESLFSETLVLALQAKTTTGDCHRSDTVAGVTQCSDMSDR